MQRSGTVRLVRDGPVVSPRVPDQTSDVQGRRSPQLLAESNHERIVARYLIEADSLTPAPAVRGWPMDSPLAGSKKCSRRVSMASSRGCPERTVERDDTRAVHSDLPPANAATASSSSSSAWSAALARLACSTGGASIVKMTWISPRNQRARSSSLASQ